MLTVYSKANCPNCDRAKNLLASKGINYNEVRVDIDNQAREFLLAQGHRSVPQIYQGSNLFVENGYSGLTQVNEGIFNQLKDAQNVS